MQERKGHAKAEGRCAIYAIVLHEMPENCNKIMDLYDVSFMQHLYH
jgi:hypothetical protein